jgi:hypothetical protein
MIAKELLQQKYGSIIVKSNSGDRLGDVRRRTYWLAAPRDSSSEYVSADRNLLQIPAHETFHQTAC